MGFETLRFVLASVLAVSLGGCSLLVDFDRSLLNDAGVDAGPEATVDAVEDAALDEDEDAAVDAS